MSEVYVSHAQHVHIVSNCAQVWATQETRGVAALGEHMTPYRNNSAKDKPARKAVVLVCLNLCASTLVVNPDCTTPATCGSQQQVAKHLATHRPT